MLWPCVALSVSSAPALINEILYDPPGPDGGHEFVELFNPEPTPFVLEDARLRFLNDADPDRATVVWSGEPGLVLGPGEFLVLGGPEVVGRDRTVDLGLQNGKEALELWVGSQRVDAVAWGAVVADDPGSGPAPPAHGSSLGRVPDGRDTGDAAVDFRVLDAPTPGRENRPAQDFALVDWQPRPVWREDAGPLEIGLVLRATGWQLAQRAELRCAGGVWPIAGAPGDTVRVGVSVDPPEGPWPLAVDLVAGGEATRLATLPLHGGVGPLVVTEIQVRPGDDEPEWLELFNRGEEAVSLESWGLRDRGGTRRRLVDAGSLEPTERVVFTGDPERLRARYPDLPARCLVPAGGWAALNDSSSDADSAADSVHLIDGTGAVVDLVTWTADDLRERGRPLQRGALVPGRASLWLPAVGGPTPGAPAADEARRWPGAGLDCRPDPFSPDGDGIADELEVLVVGRFEGATAGVYDLYGDLVCALELVGTGDRHAARWDGRDAGGRPVPAGAYVVVVEIGPSGAASARLRRVIGLGRAG